MQNCGIFSVPAILGSHLHSQLNRTLAPTWSFRETGCATQSRLRNCCISLRKRSWGHTYIPSSSAPWLLPTTFVTLGVRANPECEIVAAPAILGSPQRSQLNRTFAPTYSFHETECATQSRMRNCIIFSVPAILGSTLHSQLNRTMAPT
jgi:hypothetical protein